MKRGAVHKLETTKVPRARSEGDPSSFKEWMKRRFVTAYHLACQKGVSPPAGGTSYSADWRQVTCEACLATRPRLAAV